MTDILFILVLNVALMLTGIWLGWRMCRFDQFSEWLEAHADHVTKTDLEEMEKNIMSAISDFAAKQGAFNARVDGAIAGLAGDVAELNRIIQQLQNSPGGITPEDQASLDELTTRGEAIAAKLEALDALTPPAVPA